MEEPLHFRNYLIKSVVVVIIFVICASGVFYLRNKAGKEAVKILSGQQAQPVYKTIDNKSKKRYKAIPLSTDSNQWRCNYWREQYRTDKREQIRVAMEDNCSPEVLKWDN